MELWVLNVRLESNSCCHTKSSHISILRLNVNDWRLFTNLMVLIHLVFIWGLIGHLEVVDLRFRWRLKIIVTCRLVDIDNKLVSSAASSKWFWIFCVLNWRDCFWAVFLQNCLSLSIILRIRNGRSEPFTNFSGSYSIKLLVAAQSFVRLRAQLWNFGNRHVENWTPNFAWRGDLASTYVSRVLKLLNYFSFLREWKVRLLKAALFL